MRKSFCIARTQPKALNDSGTREISFTSTEQEFYKSVDITDSLPSQFLLGTVFWLKHELRSDRANRNVLAAVSEGGISEPNLRIIYSNANDVVAVIIQDHSVNVYFQMW